MSKPVKQMHLAALFPVSHMTVWRDPRAGSQVEFASHSHLARTAERGKFDALLLADFPRLVEHRAEISDVGVAGQLDQITVLSALASVTRRIGLAATVNATFNEPFDVARRLATLDHLSGGRCGWNVVTTPDAWTGENFRRGGYLPHADRYLRAAEFVDVARRLWGSWGPHGATRFHHEGAHFRLGGRFTVPTSPQVYPLTIQAGDSEQGREFAAATAEMIYSRRLGLAGQAFYSDVKRRLARHGRAPEHVKIMPGVSFVLGDTDEEARENAEIVQRRAVSPQLALWYLERVWGRDLSAYDPDGPLPDVDPDPEAAPPEWPGLADAEVRSRRVQKWRALAAEQNLGIRALVMKLTAGRPFIGTPARVARQMNDYVQSDGADGFVVVPRFAPGGLDEFVDRVVPELQDRGVFRTEYTDHTLRGHLGLPAPAGHPRGELR
ncbi:NtaA/DmoA family FMN-dependent monooxygenase [Streptomyces sp. NBC_00249]|uniref:NtaA/DmoA family FMN-dependent monooxygenase n=1 Tax=Streptomyces sp. NBC_00249 TaxID=2975690 RepID=UPI00225A8694|nr:NtaA/DmoA family FMN-dependent monooxygenase [Streptomyces sp. NBC_00249]MCX5195371.1 NtaA/DmoA family FMN-dependent monooxygenase [Streptomyces sp. NBC_00249]